MRYETDKINKKAVEDPLPVEDAKIKMEARKVEVYYGSFRAIKNIDLKIPDRSITALIGPSGCGKSTFLRVLNRMNDTIPSASVKGEVMLEKDNIYDKNVDAVEVRKRVGMVFQQPNPFPKSIFDNVAYGPKVVGAGKRNNLIETVEKSLRRAALWDEVKDKLKQSGLALSGGQQQRLCIARTLAIDPEVILMDEPASALDPVSTQKIEDLMQQLKERYTIVIVTHNMQQAARISDFTAFFHMDRDRAGYLVEYGTTKEIFSNPTEKLTEDYITGRFG